MVETDRVTVVALHTCEACAGQATIVEQVEEHHFVSSPCPWCDGNGTMTEAQFASWREHRADVTPVVRLSASDVAAETRRSE